MNAESKLNSNRLKHLQFLEVCIYDSKKYSESFLIKVTGHTSFNFSVISVVNKVE
jgi:hypothetical protein